MTAVLSCIFFAAISGSSPATVVAVGTLLIPAMVASGYGRQFSTGLIATSGSLGILIPPSIPLIVYGIATEESIGDLFIAGILPGLFAGAPAARHGRRRLAQARLRHRRERARHDRARRRSGRSATRP